MRPVSIFRARSVAAGSTPGAGALCVQVGVTPNGRSPGSQSVTDDPGRYVDFVGDREMEGAGMNGEQPGGGTPPSLWDAYAAVACGEIAAVRALLAPDVIGHEHSKGTTPRTLRGREAVLLRLADIAVAHWEHAIIALHALLPTSRYRAVVATWHATSRFTGHAYAVRHVLIAELDYRGRVVEVWLIYERPRPDAGYCDDAVISFAEGVEEP